MVAADIGLVATMDKPELYQPVALSFDPKTLYTRADPVPESTIYVIKPLNFQQLESYLILGLSS